MSKEETYRIVIELNKEEVEAVMRQCNGILRRKIPEELQTVLDKTFEDIKKHYVKES